MEQIKWCKSQPKGIKLVLPNENLFKEYIATAEETLDVLRAIQGKSRIWQATMKYYCEYFAAYALMMKIGLKSEIHSCTIAACRMLENMLFLPMGFSSRLESDMQLRIDNQYYLKNTEVNLDHDKMLELILHIKNLTLTNEDIDMIRDIIAAQ